MGEFQARVHVSLKEGVQDPVGQTLLRSLGDLGLKGITDLSTGKFFEVALKADSPEAAEKELDRLCDELLANPNIEMYSFELRDKE